jgi:hypothetical protein
VQAIQDDCYKIMGTTNMIVKFDGRTFLNMLGIPWTDPKGYFMASSSAKEDDENATHYTMYVGKNDAVLRMNEIGSPYNLFRIRLKDIEFDADVPASKFNIPD